MTTTGTRLSQQQVVASLVEDGARAQLQQRRRDSRQLGEFQARIPHSSFLDILPDGLARVICGWGVVKRGGEDEGEQRWREVVEGGGGRGR